MGHQKKKGLKGEREGERRKEIKKRGEEAKREIGGR